MNTEVRHRVVHATSPSRLRAVVARLMNEGWRGIGEPTLASPLDLRHPPLWVQVMYFSPREIPCDAVAVEDSWPSAQTGDDSAPPFPLS